MWTCRPLPSPEWPSLAAFIHRHNQRPDGRVRCLHAEQGASEADHAQELRELAAGEAVFVVAESSSLPLGPWAGVIGAEFDTALGRAWLRGPLVDPMAAPEAAALRRQLIAALLQALPSLQCFDAFPSADEEALVSAYRDSGFSAMQQHHVMRLDKPAAMSADRTDSRIVVLQPGDPGLAAVTALHDRLFPNSYLPGQALAASLDDAHRLFVAQGPAGMAGYLCVKHQRLENDAYVDFLGVVETARGQGLGRALLAAAARWAFAERGLPCMHLTVRQDRAPALGLYLGAGFHEVAAGRQMTLQRGGELPPA